MPDADDLSFAESPGGTTVHLVDLTTPSARGLALPDGGDHTAICGVTPAEWFERDPPESRKAVCGNCLTAAFQKNVDDALNRPPLGGDS